MRHAPCETDRTAAADAGRRDGIRIHTKAVNQTQTVARYLGRARAETSSLVRPTSVGPPD